MHRLRIFLAHLDQPEQSTNSVQKMLDSEELDSVHDAVQVRFVGGLDLRLDFFETGVLGLLLGEMRKHLLFIAAGSKREHSW